MTRSDTPVGGQAAELPAGYIRRGMSDDIDDGFALGDILTPRRPAAPAAPDPEPEPARPLATPTPPAEPAAQAVAPAPSPSPRPAPTTPERPARRTSGRARATPPEPLGSTVIRPSVVHVPAHLLALVAAERGRSGRSNGEILIAAIEDCHDRLSEQRDTAAPIGGQLFAARVAKPRLPVHEPLSPLNIRLYEQDFEVLDRLVADLGVGSRSRLATLALSDYLDGTTASTSRDHAD